MNNILIAADHAGFELKQEIIRYLEAQNYIIVDYGCFNKEAVDYPDYANKLCKVLKTREKGILVCGTGIGMSIAANRFNHIRAALCTNEMMAKFAREHNDANILVLGARIIDHDTAFACLNQFLTTKFKGEEKHQNRINKL